MNAELKSMIEDDIYRCFGSKKIPLKNKIIQKDLGLKYLKIYRKANYYCYKSNNKILKYYYIIRLVRLSKKTQFQIPEKTVIGKGCYIGHNGRVIINPEAKLGDNINLATGVVIGQENRGRKKGTPTIGNKVWIGANAVIVGKITVGNNVLIAPNAYVNMDIPDNSIVIGNPARIIENKNACDFYVENIV